MPVSSSDAELPETARFWYQAASTYGDIRLCTEVVVPAPGTNNLGSALVLGQVEQLCEALEHWLGTPLEITPSPTPEHSATWQVCLRPCDAGSAIALDVSLPAEAIESLPPIPEALVQSVEFHWEKVTSFLALAPVMLTSTECGQLLDGSVLLLPGSSSTNWACQLTVFDGRLSLAALFEPEKSDLSVQQPVVIAPPASSAQQTDRIAIELLLQQPLTLHAGKLIDSLPGPCVAIPGSLNDLLFSCVRNDKQIASGYIGPLGQGYALFVTRPDESPITDQAS